jgi:hypothetical protein
MKILSLPADFAPFDIPNIGERMGRQERGDAVKMPALPGIAEDV